jgi:hypothetical protein
MRNYENNTEEVLELQYPIKQTDNKIYAMVYELYGLTEKEIKIMKVV